MQGSKRRVMLATVAALLLGACSSTAATTTTEAQVTTTTTSTTQPPASTTTTVAPTTTTTSTLPEGTVGDPAALQALAEEVARESGIPIDDFLIPNITQPDPVEALKELVAYSDWMVFNHPDKELARIHTMEGSPARTAERNVVDPLESFLLMAVAPSPLVASDYSIVEFDQLPTTQATVASFPDDAVAVRFISSSEGYDIVDKETGAIDRSVPPWTDLPIYVVVAPTPYGWQEYWYGT